MKILHLSDIHFGRDNKKYKIEGGFKKKQEILNNLLDTIKDLQDKPDYIIVTGDIAWHGKKNEFEEAANWFKKLLEVTNLTSSDISFCPGNHDVNRGYVNFDFDINPNAPIEKMDEYYDYNRIHNVESPLENYNWFCHQLGVTPYEYPYQKEYRSSYSVGYRNICKKSKTQIRLFSFNTALFSALQSYPDDKNLIGQPQIRELKKYNLMKSDEIFQIAIFHHAERFLHPDEISEYNLRKATLPLLRENVDLVLCGHTETGGKPVLYHQDGGAYMLTAGATYYDDHHPNSFSIIDVGKNIRPIVKAYICEGIKWKRLLDSNTEIETSSIEQQPIAGELKGQGVFTISSGDNSYNIPISNLKLYLTDDNHGKMDNIGDPTRLLDISVEGSIKTPGRAVVRFKKAPEKVNSVEALLEREKVFAFLHEAMKSNQKSRFEMKNAAGVVFFSGDDITCKDEENDDKAGIEILEKLRFIEKQLDIRFKCPSYYDEQDEEQIDYIIELLHNKPILLQDKDTIKKASVTIKEIEKLKVLYRQAKIENTFYLVCNDRFTGKLVGRSFELDDLSVFTGPYTVNVKDLKYKTRTFVNGDSRVVIFTRTKETKTFIMLKENICNISTQFKEPCESKLIQIGNMNLNIGFIKEQLH